MFVLELHRFQTDTSMGTIGMIWKETLEIDVMIHVTIHVTTVTIGTRVQQQRTHDTLLEEVVLVSHQIGRNPMNIATVIRKTNGLVPGPKTIIEPPRPPENHV